LLRPPLSQRANVTLAFPQALDCSLQHKMPRSGEFLVVGLLLLSPAEALDQGCSVVLYDGGAFDGTSVSLTLGDYSLADLVAKGTGFGDDMVSSLTVSGTRCVATLYNYDNLQTSGWYKNYPEGEYPLLHLQTRGGTNDQTTSVRVWRTSCSITIFDDADLQTTSSYRSFLVAPYTRADITSLSAGVGPETTNSIRVAGPRCYATVYADTNFDTAGWYAQLPEGDYNSSALAARGKVPINSIKVEVSACTATLFEGNLLEDGLWRLSLLVGDYPLINVSDYSLSSITALSGGYGAGLVSSLRVSGSGCVATAYESPTLSTSGWTVTFPEGDYPSTEYVAGGAVDNQLSSVQVTYVYDPFSFPTHIYTGNSGTGSLLNFFHVYIGEQWVYDSAGSLAQGMTLSAGDAVHAKAILRSAMFVLQPSTQISVITTGGGTGSVFTTSIVQQGAVVESAGNTDGFGFLGLAIQDVETNMWLVSKRRSTAGSTFETVTFETTDLDPYANKQVTLDVVDAYSGTDGWLSIDRVTFSVACAPIVVADSCQFDVTNCAAVMPGTACLIECSTVYTGTASPASCPAGNTDSTTPLTYSGLPDCRLPCPSPSPMPTGYVAAAGDTVVCDTGYVGTAVKTCSVDSATCTRTAAVSGCVTAALASVAGDPITYYGQAIRREFKITAGGPLTTLLKVPDMHVLATAVEGSGEEQWLDRISVTTPAGEEVVNVAIKSNLFDFNRSALPPNAFETLSVKMDWWFSRPLAIMPPADEYYVHWHGLRVAFGRARGTPLDAPRREMVMVVSRFVNVYITSSSAHEYYEQAYLAYKYAHLDVLLGDMRNHSSFKGLLPELWGFTQPNAGESEEHSV